MMRLRQKNQNEESRLKNQLLAIVDGKTVTYIMTIVVIFSLFGDDIRVWATPKAADPYFYAGFLLSFVMFTVEILIKTVVDEEHKYSFFFWLDIIATLSLILDIPWFIDPLSVYLFNSLPSNQSVNAIPGEPLTEDAL